VQAIETNKDDPSMKFTEDFANTSHVIRSYSVEGLDINGNIYTSSLIVSPDSLIPEWLISDISQLSSDHFISILDAKPEIVIIGTGERLRFPGPEVYAEVINLNIGVEFMDSGAACRTYNVLVSENRHVVAGIILNI
jgi:uncharacterized protein